MRFHKANGQNLKFSVQAFRYLGKTTTVYVHCYVFLCHNSSSHSRCKSGCIGNNVNRIRRDVEVSKSSYSHSYLLEAGPIALDKEEGRPNKEDQGECLPWQNLRKTKKIFSNRGQKLFLLFMKFWIKRENYKEYTVNPRISA